MGKWIHSISNSFIGIRKHINLTPLGCLDFIFHIWLFSHSRHSVSEKAYVCCPFDSVALKQCHLFVSSSNECIYLTGIHLKCVCVHSLWAWFLASSLRFWITCARLNGHIVFERKKKYVFFYVDSVSVSFFFTKANISFLVN